MKTIPGFSLDLPSGDVLPVLKRVVGFTPLAVAITDAQGVVVGANRAFSRLAGNSDGPGCELNLKAFVAAHAPAVAEALEGVFLGVAMEPVEFAVVRPGPVPRGNADGAAPIWVEAHAFPIRDDQDNVRYGVFVASDVTARKSMEGMVLQTAKVETIATMAGGLAHDFNNILSGIVGYASLLAARLTPGSPDHEAAQTILDAADRAVALTGSLMTIARRTVPVVHPLDLREMLPKTLGLLAQRGDPRWRFDLVVAPDLQRIAADRPQIEQVIANLVSNAREAMPDGGLVTVRATNRTFAAGSARPLPNMPSGTYVLIEVSDTGRGMTPDIVARLFEPFFTTRPMAIGSGLGMAVVHGIVKTHRGFIVVASQPGQGTTIGVYLPVGKGRRESQERLVVRAAGADERLGARSVLVIDDDPMVRRVLLDMLARLGHRGMQADGMDAALDLLMREPGRFDLLLVDVFMPDRSGLELVETLRRSGMEIPAILVTGFSSADVQSKVRHLSATSVLCKPFDVTGLSDAIRTALAN
jgi:two-component system cell cycle sensor histidine kinase/response regulator CckA